jgi:hypothetical protein
MFEDLNFILFDSFLKTESYNLNNYYNNTKINLHTQQCLEGG